MTERINAITMARTDYNSSISDNNARTHRKPGRKCTLYALAAAAVIILCIALKPSYDRYMAADHLETCQNFRNIIVWNFDGFADHEPGSRSPDSSIDFAKVLREVLTASFGEDTADKLVEIPARDGAAASFLIPGCCRAGGTTHVDIRWNNNKQKFYPECTCDAPGHS